MILNNRYQTIRKGSIFHEIHETNSGGDRTHPHQAAMYVVTLILAFSRSEATGRWFIASLACTFLFPALLYIYLRSIKS